MDGERIGWQLTAVMQDGFFSLLAGVLGLVRILYRTLQENKSVKQGQSVKENTR